MIEPSNFVLQVMRITLAEENYLKVIYRLSQPGEQHVSNLAIAGHLAVRPATVTEMLRRLKEKRLVDYSRSNGATLTKAGARVAVEIIRRHRLWETFLFRNLQFSWSEVHDVAEQLEHVRSEKLVEQLDRALGYPKHDPHGDPIPDKRGTMPQVKSFPLTKGAANKPYRVVGVESREPAILQFLNSIGLAMEDTVEIEEVHEFDKSIRVTVNGKFRTLLTAEVSRCLLVM
jgi:DtxR family Mn-dependent transcriptional regulator